MITWTPDPHAKHTFETTNSYLGESVRHTMRRTLDEIMGLDAPPVQVHADGTLTTRSDLYVPDVNIEATDDGSSYLPGAIADAVPALGPWEPVRGCTGQYGSTSASWLMHASEFIGGGMADRILREPGIYAAVVVYPIAGEDVEVEPTEWALLRRETTD